MLACVALASALSWHGPAPHRAPLRLSSPPAASAKKGAAAIVGAGPAGLLSAIMLAQRGWERIDVYDGLRPPPAADDPLWGAGERSYQLGLNGRGQRSLREFGAMERVDRFAASVNGRLSFGADGAPNEARLKPPGTPGAEKSYVTRVMQRDRLQACLLEECRSRYPQVRVSFETACAGVDVGGALPELKLCETAAEEAALEVGCSTDADVVSKAYDLVIGADGVRSAVRDSLEAAAGSTTRTVRFADKNERVYKTLPLHPANVEGTSADLNWGGRNASLGLGMDALPTKEGEMVAVLLFKPGSKAYDTIDGLETADEAKAFIGESLPPLLPYVREDELGRFVRRPISRLPSFQLVEGDVHRATPRGGVVLLGDAIKAVKPYFGQGCNSALEDVSVLARCLEASADDPARACAAFTAARADDARALVRTSRGFDMPGPLGTARFLVPLVLDIQLNKLLPALFSPPMLRGLQDERNTFVGLRWKKRRERSVQLAMLAALGLGCASRPMLAAKVAYVGTGVGIGYGSVSFTKFVAGGGIGRVLAAAALGARARAVRAKLRAAVLRIDPSLAEREGESIGWADLKPAPLKKKKGRGSRGPPGNPLW